MLLEPLGQAIEVGRGRVDAGDVVAGEVDVEVFVDVDCEVVCGCVSEGGGKSGGEVKWETDRDG